MVPRMLSYSQISSFLTCEQKWVLQYLQKAERVPNAAMFFGSLIHGLLEHSYANGRELTTKEQIAVFTELASTPDYREQQGIDFPAKAEHAFALYHAYSVWYADWGIDVVAVEDKRKDPALGLSGVADLLYRWDAGGVVLREHKTRQQFVNNPADIQVHLYQQLYPEIEAVEYNQLKSYEYKGGIKPEDGSKLFLRVPVLSSKSDQERLNLLLDTTRTRMDEIEHEGRKPVGAYLHHVCARCDFKGECPWTVGI
jgi:hypothetical protein